MSIPVGQSPVQYPGGDLVFEKGFLEELAENVPLLGADREFESDLSEKLGTEPLLCPEPNAAAQTAWLKKLVRTKTPISTAST